LQLPITGFPEGLYPEPLFSQDDPELPLPSGFSVPTWGMGDEVLRVWLEDNGYNVSIKFVDQFRVLNHV